MKSAYGLVLAVALGLSSLGYSVAKVNEPAPAFSGKDSTGKTQKLEDYKGKWVVLEWFNKDCPFVRKHYDSKNMQNLQKKYTQKGVVWLQVNSSAEGKEGYENAEASTKTMKKEGVFSNALILDTEGTIGKAYDAKTTPHMYVIDPKGTLVYAGAIDDKASANKDDIAKSTNYVAAALDAGLAGQKVATATAKAYGCGVKYKN